MTRFTPKKSNITLQPGDFALCSFGGTWLKVRITHKQHANSQSHIAYLCDPKPPGARGWLDAAWFIPVDDK